MGEEETTNLSFSATFAGVRVESKAVSTLPGALQDGEKAYKLKNFATRGSKECGEGVPIQASESLAELTEDISLPRAGSKDWRR